MNSSTIVESADMRHKQGAGHSRSKTWRRRAGAGAAKDKEPARNGNAAVERRGTNAKYIGMQPSYRRKHRAEQEQQKEEQLSERNGEWGAQKKSKAMSDSPT